MLHRISTRLQAAPGNDEISGRPPTIFVNAQSGFNAFRSAGNVISINEGVFGYCRYNEDMVAFVVAHEIAHGTQQHFLRKMDALIGYDVAKKLYAKRYELELSRLDFIDYAARQVQANGYSIPHEWEADNVASTMPSPRGITRVRAPRPSPA
jgi:predicted Zn-dependent protease